MGQPTALRATPAVAASGADLYDAVYGWCLGVRG